MNYNLLHTITGFGIILSLIAKVITHYYIDYVHERGLSLSSLVIMPLYYFRPYNSEVNPEYKILKYICNSFLILAGLSLFLNIVFGVLLIP